MGLVGNLGKRVPKLSNGLGTTIGTIGGGTQIHISVITPEQPIAESKEEKDPIKEKMSDFGLRLLNRDTLSDEEQMTLTQDLTLYIRSLLKQNKKSLVESFLDEHKDHLTSDMKDLISDEIKEMDK